jgi:excisionase family DNA binding protein
MHAEERLLLRMGDAAAMLSISRAKCYELVNRGVIPVVRLDGSSMRVPVAALRSLIARQLTEGNER